MCLDFRSRGGVFFYVVVVAGMSCVLWPRHRRSRCFDFGVLTCTFVPILWDLDALWPLARDVSQCRFNWLIVGLGCAMFVLVHCG